MAEYNQILTDPYNPVKIEKDVVIFPEWLTEDIVVQLSEFKIKKNNTIEDEIISLHASYYDAINWYPQIKDYTPDSVFIELTDEEVAHLINDDHQFPPDKVNLVNKFIADGYQFVKSTRKSSHSGKKINNFEEFMDEITHPQVVMSFKKGCRSIFMRKYIENIISEYRVYVYDKKLDMWNNTREQHLIKHRPKAC